MKATSTVTAPRTFPAVSLDMMFTIVIDGVSLGDDMERLRSIYRNVDCAVVTISPSPLPSTMHGTNPWKVEARPRIGLTR